MHALEYSVESRIDELTERVRSRARGDVEIGSALASGAAGALALTAMHQLARDRVPNAPRMDILGLRAIARGLDRVGVRPPTGRRLYRTTLAADLAANTAYYSAVAFAGRHATRAGLALGLAAGVGALVLPPVIGLGRPPHVHAWSNRLMTVALYTLGGLVAGEVYHRMRSRSIAPRPLLRRLA